MTHQNPLSARRSTLRLGILLAAAGLAAAGAPALAQSRSDKPAEPPLKGPPVRNNRPPALEDRLTEGRARQAGGAPLRELNAILGKLRADDAPAKIRLTDDQDAKIKAIQDEFRAQQRAFEGQRRGEMPDRPNRARPKRPQGENDGAEGGMEMRGDAPPRPRDVMTRIHAVLTEPQKEFVDAELETLRAANEKKRAEEYVKRRMEERGDSPAPSADRPAPERLRLIAERLRELPPEQRERLLRKFEEDLDKAENAGRGKDAGTDGMDDARPVRERKPDAAAPKDRGEGPRPGPGRPEPRKRP